MLLGDSQWDVMLKVQDSHVIELFGSVECNFFFVCASYLHHLLNFQYALEGLLYVYKKAELSHVESGNTKVEITEVYVATHHRTQYLNTKV